MFLTFHSEFLCFTGLLPFNKVVDNFDAEYEYLTNNGTVFTFKTNKDAAKYKIINIDFSKIEEVSKLNKYCKAYKSTAENIQRVLF